MFHIIGVAHRAQAVAPCHALNDEQKLLSSVLTEIVQQVGPALIAEEQSQEGLGQNISIPQRIAQEKGIEHRFCDPNQLQRTAMGYRDRIAIGQQIFFSDEGWVLSPAEIDAKAGAIEFARYFPLRERFWLEQIQDRAHLELAFICGDAHVEGFTTLLNTKGISHRIWEREIGVNDEDRMTFGNAMKYLEQHPEIRVNH